MNENGDSILRLQEEKTGFWKRNLADFLTLSRILIGIIVLALSLLGKSAYLAVVILTLSGAATDIFDGKVARHYLGTGKEGRLGKHDAEIDTFFVLCVLAYFSLSGVIINKEIGLGWIGLSLICYILSRRDLRVLVVTEVCTVIALLAITLLYDTSIFVFIISPAMAAGLFINRHRVIYLLFEYWPVMFRKH